MPPGKHTALIRAWKKKERRKSERFAMLASLLANINRKKGTTAYEISDFIGEDDED